MEVSAGFILGFDGDRDDIFDRQIRFIQEAAIPTAMVGLLTALPNTQLYRRLEKEGRITEDSGGNNTHDLRLNFVPRMETGKLLAGYKKVLSEIYSPDLYFDRCLTLLKNTRKHRTSARRIGAWRCGAFTLLPPPPDPVLVQLAVLEVHDTGLLRQTQLARGNGDHGREGAPLLQDDEVRPGAGRFQEVPGFRRAHLPGEGRRCFPCRS